MQVLVRARQFWQKPWSEKGRSVRGRAKRLLSRVPSLLRLPFGGLWILRNDAVGDSLLKGRFENPERRFVERFVKKGMTVLDLGAHHGLYTLLFSKHIGSDGKVIAFEPSMRERRALRLNVLLNARLNVSIQKFAVGNKDSEVNFHVVRSHNTGCNSLRPPAADVGSETRQLRVRTVRLDEWLKSEGIGKVDFIKLDVEGGELDALHGAEELLEERPRPVILAEVQDIRTRAWGYSAKDIIRYLIGKRYQWFALSEDGSVEPLDESRDEYDGNFVACPEESVAMLRSNLYA